MHKPGTTHVSRSKPDSVTCYVFCFSFKAHCKSNFIMVNWTRNKVPNVDAVGHVCCSVGKYQRHWTRQKSVSWIMFQTGRQCHAGRLAELNSTPLFNDFKYGHWVPASKSWVERTILLIPGAGPVVCAAKWKKCEVTGCDVTLRDVFVGECVLLACKYLLSVHRTDSMLWFQIENYLHNTKCFCEWKDVA